jgi:hypothetical protein
MWLRTLTRSRGSQRGKGRGFVICGALFGTEYHDVTYDLPVAQDFALPIDQFEGDLMRREQVRHPLLQRQSAQHSGHFVAIGASERTPDSFVVDTLADY